MKKILALLSLAVILLLAGCQQNETDAGAVFYFNDENKSSYALENDCLKLEMNGKTGYFDLTDKVTGKVWNSNPVAAAEDSSADPSTRYAMLSSLVLTYVDKTGNEVIYDGYRYSVKEGTFQIFQEEDVLLVKYTIGQGEKFYIIPEAISEERLSAIMEKMDPTCKALVLRTYLRYDISKMKDQEKIDLILEKIPFAKDGVVYALASATGGKRPQRYQMEKLEEGFMAAGYTKEQAEADQVEEEQTTQAIMFNVTMRYSLDGDALKVEIPEEEIYYPSEHPIYQLDVLPYFLSAGSSSEGYLLVPDGGGAQIFFNNGKIAQTPYYTSIYGWDEAYDRPKRVQDPDASFPVFGMAADGNYLLAVAEEGAPEMSVEADVGGKRSSYNYVCPIFNVVHGEDTSVSAKSEATVRVFQSDDPDEVLTLRYYSGGSSSYVDMAQRYRTYLQKKYPHLVQNEESGVPLVVELVGAIDRVEKILGVPVRQTMAAVDYKEAAQIVKALADIDNLRIRYTSVLNGGSDQTSMLSVSRISKLGSEADRKAFLNAVTGAGAQLYIDGYVQSVFNDSWFNVNAHSIRDTTNTVIKRYPYRQEMQTETKQADDLVYLLNGSAIQKAMQKLAGESANWSQSGISFSDVGDLIYSDFSHKHPTSRDDMLRLQQLALQGLRENGHKLMVTSGNDYAAVMADCIVNMDLSGNRFDLVDRQIPFYQIALHGLVSYTGEPLNGSADYRQSLLKSVETGAGLSFRFAETNYRDLQYNRYTYLDALFGSEFADWEEELTSVYQRLNGELGHTAGIAINDHYYVTDTVTCTVYEDGTRVYVNYGLSAVTAEGVKIGAEDWTVVKGG